MNKEKAENEKRHCSLVVIRIWEIYW